MAVLMSRVLWSNSMNGKPLPQAPSPCFVVDLASPEAMIQPDDIFNREDKDLLNIEVEWDQLLCHFVTCSPFNKPPLTNVRPNF